MTKNFAANMLIAIASIAFVGVAQAQVAVPPGTDIYATPMSKGEPTVAQMKIVPAPAAAKKMPKHKMMKHKMMNRAAKK